MPEDDRGDATLARARAQGRRAAHGLIIVVAVLFIGASTVQIVGAVFAVGRGPLSAPGPCALGVRRLANAIASEPIHVVDDPGTSDPGTSEPVGEGDAVFESNPSAPHEHAPCDEGNAWSQADSVARACAATREGLDAWAALQRLRLAQRALARRDRTDLEPLDRDVSAHLPADLR